MWKLCRQKMYFFMQWMFNVAKTVDAFSSPLGLLEEDHSIVC